LKKNCPYCLKKQEVDKDWLKKIKIDYKIKKLSSSYGCVRCNYSSYNSVLPIFELLAITNDAKINNKFEPMIYDALEKANNSVFSPEEILKSLKQ